MTRKSRVVRKASLSVLGCLLALTSNVHPEERSLRWPLDTRIAPTSSFCEFRPFRFHAGFDLSTGGSTGVPIFAIADGYVARVRVSPYGYGKVLYIRHDDGRTSVVAHLSRFNDAVEDIVLREQMRHERYTVDLYPTVRRVRVRRGDVVAYSGATGIGVPHLHFEIRDERNVPVNPFENGLSLTDDVPPTLAALAFVPLDAHARVNGDSEPVIVPLANYGGIWTSRTMPRLWGRVGVALAAWDRTPHGRYRLGLHSMRLAADSVEVFRRRYDRMPFASEHLSVFDRNFFLLASGEGRYLNLYVPPGNTLPFYDDLPVNSGVLECGTDSVTDAATALGPGRHRIEVTGYDFLGNSAHGNLTILVERSPQIVECIPSFPSDSSGAVSVSVRISDPGDSLTVAAYASEDGGRTWVLAEGSPPDSVMFRDSAALDVTAPSDSALLRIVAQDTSGVRVSRVVDVAALREPPRLRLKQTWWRDWCILEMHSSRPLRRMPEISAYWSEEVVTPLESREVRPGFYETDIVPDPTWPKDYRIRVFAGAGRPTVVTQWVSESVISGVTDFVPVRDTLTSVYHGIVKFEESFPDSGTLRLVADEVETTLVVRGKLIGPIGGRYERRDLGAAVEFGRGVVPEPTFIRIERDSLPAFRELEPLGDAVAFEPQAYPFAGNATLMVTMPDTLDLTGVALYGVARDGATAMAVPEKSFDHTIRARVGYMATVGLYRDTTPPTIAFVQPRRNATITNRRPTIVASIRDYGAGFARSDDAMEMRIDDAWVPAEYDPEQHRLRYQPKESFARGRRTVVIHARDGVGNEQTATLTFTVQ